MHLQEEFERLYGALADENSATTQKQAGVDLVPLVGRAMFMEWPEWQRQQLDTLHLQQFVLNGRVCPALPASLLVDIKAIPALGIFDPGSCNIFLLQPPNSQVDPVPVYELKRANRREASQLDLCWLELETLRNLIRSLLVSHTPKVYNMEHAEMMEDAYKTGWRSFGDPPLDPKLLRNC